MPISASAAGQRRLASMSRERTSARATRRERDRTRERHEKRARRLSAAPQALADAVVTHGDGFLGVALIARHRARAHSVINNRAMLPEEAWAVLGLVPLADAALCRFGCPWPLAPDLWGRRDWLEQLRWGLDRIADTCRLLRIGEVFGATVLARQQLERWTHNVAHYHGLEQQRAKENTADYINRVWSVYPSQAGAISLGRAWNELSEGMHGRGPLVSDLAAEAASVSSQPLVFDSVARPPFPATSTVVAVINAVGHQVRGGVSVLAEEADLSDVAAALQGEVVPPNAFMDVVPSAGLAPLDVAILHQPIVDEAVRVAEMYRRAVGGADALTWLAKTGYWPLAAMALLERRGRAAELARRAFDEEQNDLGEDFDPRRLHARLFRYIAISEAAALLGAWSVGPERSALITAAAALRSAWVLWLEDTDLSLPCVRTTLEQSCRARAWRIKPHRAEKVEASVSVAPVRWAEAAGYRRLSVLSRALGEFSHLNPRVRWTGARQLLTAVQHPEHAPYPDSTARGYALDSAAYLLAHEVATRLTEVNPRLAEAFRSTVTLLDEEVHEERIESLLERSMQHRAHDFGDPDLHQATDQQDP